MTKIRDVEAKKAADKLAKKAELDPSRVPGFVAQKVRKVKKGKK
jgi:hypothetical protein